MAKRIGPVLAVIGSDTKGFTDGLSKAQKSMQQFSSTAAIAGVRASAAFAATFGVIGAFAIKVGADFELAFANVRKTVEGSEADFAKLEVGIRSTAKEFGIAATEIADLARIGGQLGIATQDLDAFTKTISKLSIAAAELDPETAARGLARLAALTKEGSGSIEKMANVLAKLGDTLPTTESRILDFGVRMASFGAAIGLSSEEILGLAGGFSALVGGTERAATAVERFLGELATAIAKPGPELDAFAELAINAFESPIKSVEEFSQVFKDAPLQAIELVIGGMEKLSEDGLAPLLQSFDALGITGVRMLSTFAAAGKGADTLRLALATAAKEAKEQAKLQKELEIQLNTVRRQFDRLKVAVTDVGIQLFQAFREQIMAIISAGFKFVSVLSRIAKFIMDLGPATKFAIIGVIGLLGAMAGLLVVLGIVGGLITGVSALLTTLGGLFVGVGGAAATSSAGVATYGVATGAATASTSIFAGALASVQATLAPIAGALGAIGGPLATVAAGILVGVSAADALNSKAVELQGTMDDLTQTAVANAGIFAKAWEGTKMIVGLAFEGIVKGIVTALGNIGESIVGVAKFIGSTLVDNFKNAVIFGEDALKTVFGDEIIENFIATLDNAGSAVGDFFNKFSPEGLAVAFDVVGDKATEVAEGFLRVIGKFPPAVQEVTAAQMFQAKALGVTITGMDTAESVGRKLIKAQQDQKKAFDESAEGMKAAAAAQAIVTATSAEMIAKLLATKDTTNELKEAAKGLGISQDDLTKIIEKQGPEFLKLVQATLKKKEADEEATKAAEALAEAVKSLTVEGAVEEFKNLSEQIKFATDQGKTFTDDAVAQLGEELERLAEITGKDLTPRQLELVQAWKDGVTAAKAAAAATKEDEEAKKAAAKAAQELTDAIKGITVSGAIEEFNELQKLLEEVNKRGETLTEEGLKKMAEEAKRLADVTGKELSPEMEKIIDRFEELSEQDVKIKQIEDELKEAKGRTREWNQALTAVKDVMSILGISSDSAFAQILGGITIASQAASKFGESILEAKLQIAKLGEGGFGKFLSEGGLEAGIELGTALVQGVQGVISAGGEGGLAGAIGGAIAGAQLGAEIGDAIGIPGGKFAGAAIGAGIGAAISLFRGKPEFKKIMEDIGRDWGIDISEELAKEIEATAERLDLGRMEATLLNLSSIIAEAGGVIEFGTENATTAVNDLMNAIELGVVPAAEGIEELGTVFTQMADELFKAGTIADAALLQVIDRARQLGIEVPEIAAFIADQLAQAAAGVTKIIGTAFEDADTGEVTFGGIQVATPEDAQAQATIFSSAFFATLQEQGLIAAVDAFAPAFDEMKKKFMEFGDEIDFGGVQRFFDLAQDPQFRPLLEGVTGLTEAMTGLGNAGFLTADTFSAFQQQGAAAFDQMTALGLSSTEALQQMAPFLQEAINASQTFGFTLDENTQNLIDQAEAAGIGFATDPMTQMVDVLALIAEQLGVTTEALAGVGVGAQVAGQQVQDSLGGEVPGHIREEWDLTEDDVSQSFHGMAAGAQQAADDIANSAAQATEATQTVWADTQMAVSAGFDETTANILEDYVTVIEQTGLAGQAVASLGDSAHDSAEGFDRMASAARAAADAARSAAGAGGGGPPQGGQFGLTTTVNEPTSFIAGEAGEETVTIDPGGGGAPGGAPQVVVLQIDGKTIGKVLGDLSRTGDVRIHPSAVQDFG